MINFSWAGVLDFVVIRNYSAGEVGHEYRIVCVWNKLYVPQRCGELHSVILLECAILYAFCQLLPKRIDLATYFLWDLLHFLLVWESGGIA